MKIVLLIRIFLNFDTSPIVCSVLLGIVARFPNLFSVFPAKAADS